MTATATDDTDFAADDAVPVHFVDAGPEAGTVCSRSGTVGWTEGETCAEGHDSARTHYSNDGHRACEDDGS